MKKFIFLSVAFFLMLISISIQKAEAHYVGLSNHEATNMRISGLYSYSRGDYELVDTGGDSKLIEQLYGARLDVRLTEEIQIYGIMAQSQLEFGDSEPEDATVYGGGIQYLLEPGPPYYLKLTGAVFKHEERDFKDNSGTFEMVTDWQAGVLLGHKVDQQNSFGKQEVYNTYIGLSYNARELEIETTSSLEYELDDFSGLNIFAGINYSITDFLTLEGEAHYGASEGGAGRIIYHF